MVKVFFRFYILTAWKPPGFERADTIAVKNNRVSKGEYPIGYGFPIGASSIPVGTRLSLESLVCYTFVPQITRLAYSAYLPRLPAFFCRLCCPARGQPFPPERRNCNHTFRGMLHFRLPSAPQRYNTLDFPRKVVCQQGCYSPLLETQSRGATPLWTPPYFFPRKWVLKL